MTRTTVKRAMVPYVDKRCDYFDTENEAMVVLFKDGITVMGDLGAV